MQVLMSGSALTRVRERIAPFLDRVEIVTISAPDRYQRDGRDIPVEEVQPDIIWSTLDAYRDGLLGALVGRTLKGRNPQWMQTFNAGLDAPIFKDIMAKGVRLTKSNAQATPIAEYVVGHAVSLILPIARQQGLQARRAWESTPYREVSQTHWVLVGYGSIGREIAKRVKAFGAQLTVVRRSVGTDALADQVIGMAGLHTALARADVVVLAPALTDETRNMCDAAFFAALQPGAILINIGRGALVDEDALKIGLNTDQPAHAVLDVFQTEPLPADHWLWSHPKVRVTAHTSNSGEGTIGRGDDLFLANLARYLAGDPLINEASPQEVGL